MLPYFFDSSIITKEFFTIPVYVDFSLRISGKGKHRSNYLFPSSLVQPMKVEGESMVG